MKIKKLFEKKNSIRKENKKKKKKKEKQQQLQKLAQWLVLFSVLISPAFKAEQPADMFQYKVKRLDVPI